MFLADERVTLEIYPSQERVSARIVHSSLAHLTVEMDGKCFPPIDSDVTVILEKQGGCYQQCTTVSGHWQHSPKATVELARVGKAVALTRQLGAA
jgi:hypothetical protein